MKSLAAAILFVFTSSAVLWADDPAPLDKARALSFSGRWGEAIQIYDAWIAEHPEDLDARLSRGRVRAWAKDFNGSENELRYVVQRSSRYADAWSALGDVCLWAGKPLEALNAFNSWVKIEPKNPAALMSRAKALYELRRFSESREDLYRAGQLGGDAEKIDLLLRDLSRIPSSKQWEAAIAFEHQSFSSENEEWQKYSGFLRREHRWGSSQIESARVRRYAKWDKSIAMDHYLDLWRKSYLNLRYQASFNGDFLPKNDAFGELFQNFGKGWEISGSYRFMDFKNDRVDQYGISLARYVSRLYLREKTVFIPDAAGGGYFQQFLGRIYGREVDSFLEISGGFDKEENSFYSFRVQKFFTAFLGLSVSGNYDEHVKRPAQRGFNVQFLTRW